MQTSDNHMTSLYQAHCIQHENLMSRRFSLLTLVPGTTVASFAITLFSNPTNTSLRNLIFPLGLAGICFLIGLFFVARISLKEGRALSDRIQNIEEHWEGRKITSYHEDWVFNQENVAGLIFSASFAGWICVALWFVFPGVAIFIAIISFFIILPISLFLLHGDVPKGSKPNFSELGRERFPSSSTQRPQAFT